jgi:hypothetical protein
VSRLQPRRTGRPDVEASAKLEGGAVRPAISRRRRCRSTSTRFCSLSRSDDARLIHDGAPTLGFLDATQKSYDHVWRPAALSGSITISMTVDS